MPYSYMYRLSVAEPADRLVTVTNTILINSIAHTLESSQLDFEEQASKLVSRKLETHKYYYEVLNGPKDPDDESST